ncbi:MAG: hypothetical protein LBC75_11790 [Fibromonadaceae bacterium]|jgi:hypothetical protein|nr:hypothetical protein [Fibromonadaceae bacterium]
MKKYLPFVVAALFFYACSSSDPKSRKDALYIPTDMPDICQNVDFNVDKGMRETCGVKPARYQAYRNVPMQRYLINPNQASIVKSGDKIEIRFPNTHPVSLDAEQVSGVTFSDSKRLAKIQNTMDYKEFFNEKKQRYKLFKLTIPSDTKPEIENNLCFRVPELKGSDRTRSAAMAAQMELISCETLDQLVKKYVN